MGIFSGYLWFWRGICRIIRQLSRRVCFRFVLHIFFFVFFLRVQICFFFLITLHVSVYSFMYLGFLDLHSLKLISRFGVVCTSLCDKLFTILSYSLKPSPRGFVRRH